MVKIGNVIGFLDYFTILRNFYAFAQGYIFPRIHPTFLALEFLNRKDF